MTNETINLWKNGIQKWNVPHTIKDLIVDVLNKYGVYISEFSDYSGSTEIYPIEVWRESVEFLLEPKADKRHFKQSELDKIVKRHENFYLGEYKRFDGSYPNTLCFYFKRPEEKVC